MSPSLASTSSSDPPPMSMTSGAAGAQFEVGQRAAKAEQRLLLPREHAHGHAGVGQNLRREVACALEASRTALVATISMRSAEQGAPTPPCGAPPRRRRRWRTTERARWLRAPRRCAAWPSFRPPRGCARWVRHRRRSDESSWSRCRWPRCAGRWWARRSSGGHRQKAHDCMIARRRAGRQCVAPAHRLCDTRQRVASGSVDHGNAQTRRFARCTASMCVASSRARAASAGWCVSRNDSVAFSTHPNG
jgi:hypothetical protein